jgi:hypothetical protein
MADITFHCPACAGELTIDEAYVGSEVQCPLCQATITIPSPASEPSVAEAEAAFPPEATPESQAAPDQGQIQTVAARTQKLTLPPVGRGGGIGAGRGGGNSTYGSTGLSRSPSSEPAKSPIASSPIPPTQTPPPPAGGSNGMPLLIAVVVVVIVAVAVAVWMAMS